MKFGLFLLIFWFQSGWAAQYPIGIHPTRFIEAEISSDLQKKLFELGKIQDVNQLLQRTTELFPGIRILIYGDVIDSPGFTAGPIAWRDPRVSKEILDFYDKSKEPSELHETYGTHVAAYKKYQGFEQRPLSEHTLLLLRPNVSRGVIFHELLHHIFDQWYLDRYARPMGSTAELTMAYKDTLYDIGKNLIQTMGERIDGGNLVESYMASVATNFYYIHLTTLSPGEEIEVVRSLIQFRKKLGLTTVELQIQARYASENLVSMTRDVNSGMKTMATSILDVEMIASTIPELVSPEFLEQSKWIRPFISGYLKKSEEIKKVLTPWAPWLAENFCEKVLTGKKQIKIFWTRLLKRIFG